MGVLDDTVERICDRIGSRAFGVVARRELLAAGVSAKQIEHRLRIGALIREYHGVYRIGHRAPSVGASYMAAIKACGEGSRLGGPAAAHWLGIVRGKAPAPEVIAPKQRRVRGVRVRRSRTRVESLVWQGIRVTTPARTLVDIARELPEDELAKACHEAGVRFKTTPREVKLLLARRPNSPGAAKLKRIASGDSPVLLSKLERRFRKLLRERRLPLPEANRRTGSFYVDCRWPGHGLTVELDSYRFHNSRLSWEQGYRREREARARGDEFRRYNWSDVFEHPAAMLADLAGLLRE